MNLTTLFVRYLAAMLVVATATVAGPGTALAEQDPGRGRPEVEPLDITVNPLNEEWLITDEMEGQFTTSSTGVTCSYETVQAGVNPAPTSPSFQLMYVVPVDVTAAAHLDVPRSCSDGSVKYSSLARSSRNMASWLAAQNTGMNYRTLALSYTHNYTGSKYSTRVVRRYRSAYTRENWSNTAMIDSSGTSSPRLAKLRAEFAADDFSVAGTKYHTLLDAGVYPVCDATTCSYTLGAATRGGQYGLLNRYYVEPGTYASKYHRFGCATKGDDALFHEATHMVGASHVTDHPRDHMTGDGGGTATFKSSPGLVWDYGRNDYDGVVRSNAYVSLSAQPGNYFPC